MLKLLFTSLILFLFTACLSTSNIILTQSDVPKVLDKSTIYRVAIPVREQGYSHFNSKIINSKEMLNTFLSTIKEQKGWKKKENFISSLTLPSIDFTKFNLLLYRMTENSGSTVLAIDVPKGNNKHVVIEIGRDKPNIGTADIAYYALAYKVAKSVLDITFDNGIKKHLIKNKSLNIQQKIEIPKN